MAIVKKNGCLFIYFRPFQDRLIGIKLLSIDSKKIAKQIEIAVLSACRSGDYSYLDPVSRETCIRMFMNQNWELPPGLHKSTDPSKELTLWDACKLFLTYPEISDHPNRWRHEFALAHLVKRLGKDTLVKSIWVPLLKRYRMERLNQDGAAPATVNRELGTLSRMFGVLIENQLIETNPVRLVKSLSSKSGEREVYLSLFDVQQLASRCPKWFQPMIWTAYFTGMRRGEILAVRRSQVSLDRRIIFLRPDQTKEARSKRVPIHHDLVPLLKESLSLDDCGSDKLFMLEDYRGTRPLDTETFKNCWPRACESLGLDQPWPRFHDLRHTWRTNARRSGVDAQIAESIIGHWYKGKSVNDRYGRISDAELLNAIDKMTFDHGETEIIVSEPRKTVLKKNVKRMLNGAPFEKKGRAPARPKLLISLVGGTGLEPATPAV